MNSFYLFLFFTFINQVPGISPDVLQLQILIENTEKQMLELKKLIESSHQNEIALKQISKATNQLVEGLDQELMVYQSDPAFQKALLQLQSENDFSRTYRDVERTMKINPLDREKKNNLEEIKQFQKHSIQANDAAQRLHDQIQKELEAAPPGLRQKLESKVYLEQWKTNRLISLQLTEIIATLHTIREQEKLQNLSLHNSNESVGKIMNIWKRPK